MSMAIWRRALNSLIRCLVVLWCLGFLVFRAGEALYLLSFKGTIIFSTCCVICTLNLVFARILKYPLPDMHWQALLLCLGSWYFQDVHMATLSHASVDMGGKVVVLTGGNSGVGYFTAAALAIRNATVVIGCRSLARCDKAAVSIREEYLSPLGLSTIGKVIPIEVDVSSLASVRRFSLRLQRDYARVDVLVNNAGYDPGVGVEEPPSSEGLEKSFATMHVGHFALTEYILERNQRGADGVIVVNTASGLHHVCALLTALTAKIDGSSDDACLRRDFLEKGFAASRPPDADHIVLSHLGSWMAPIIPSYRLGIDTRYIRAKLANVLHAHILPSRHPGLRAVAVDLGFVETNIQPWMSSGWFFGMPSPGDIGWMRKPLPHGIRPLLRAATGAAAMEVQSDELLQYVEGGLIDGNGYMVKAMSVERRLGFVGFGPGLTDLAADLYNVSMHVLERLNATL